MTKHDVSLIARTRSKINLPSTTSASKTASMCFKNPAKKGSRRTSPISLSSAEDAPRTASPSRGTSSSARRMSRSVRILDATFPGLASIDDDTAVFVTPSAGVPSGAVAFEPGRFRGGANMDVTASTSFFPDVARSRRRHSSTRVPEDSNCLRVKTKHDVINPIARTEIKIKVPPPPRQVSSRSSRGPVRAEAATPS